jgi:hypothetical protein
MFEFVVMIKHDQGKWDGLGTKKFRLAPRKGEFVSLNDDQGVGQMYETVAVIHPLELVSTSGDLVLKHVGTDLAFRQNL